MNCKKKNKEKCLYCPVAEVFPQATNPKKKLIMCKLKPEMKIDQFTRQPDWCPLKTEMQTPIELPKVPEFLSRDFTFPAEKEGAVT